MNIRILNETDALLYQELRLNALQTNPEAYGSTYERESQFTIDFVRERLKPKENKFVLGAFDESDRLVGVVTFVRESGLKESHKGNVYGMYVSPESRKQGVGRLLLEELIRRAKVSKGLEQINLTVVSDNYFAIRLYKSLGFEVFGVERNALKYNGQYFDEDWMALRV